MKVRWLRHTYAQFEREQYSALAWRAAPLAASNQRVSLRHSGTPVLSSRVWTNLWLISRSSRDGNHPGLARNAGTERSNYADSGAGDRLWTL